MAKLNSRIALLLLLGLPLLGCATAKGRPPAELVMGADTAVRPAPAVSALDVFSQPVTDRAGRAWSATVLGGYVSAAGNDCVRLRLMPAGTGFGREIARIACRDHGVAWVIQPPLQPDPGQAAAPAFAPVFDKTKG